MSEYEWENIDGGPCPQCGARLGTKWQTDEHDPTNDPPYRHYWVEPGEDMGNKSYRDDTCIGAWCPECGWKTPPRMNWFPGGLWDDCPKCGAAKRMFHRCPKCGAEEKEEKA